MQQTIPKLLPRKQYIRTVRRQYPPFYWSLMWAGISDPKLYKPLVGKAASLKHQVHTGEVVYYSYKERERVGKIIFNCLLNKKQFVRMKQLLKERENKLLQSAKNNFQSFCSAYIAYSPSVIIIYSAEHFVEDRVRELLNKKLEPKETEDLMSALNLPLEDNFYKQEEYDLVTTTDLKRHVQAYKWLLSRYGHLKTYTLSDAKQKLKKLSKAIFLNKWQHEKLALRSNIAKAKRILGPKQAHLVDLLQYYVYYRTQRTDILNRAAYIAAPILKKTAREKNLSYEQLLMATYAEIIHESFDKKELHQRLKDNATVMYRGKISAYGGKQCRAIAKYFSEESTITQNTLSGISASKGLASGIVCVIYNRKDFHKFKTGNILVASMTTPEMVPLMKKAAAIITDEGGLTCHAAIMSRELGVPCIIGTKIATRFLHNGDRVKIDTQTGTILKQ